MAEATNELLLQAMRSVQSELSEVRKDITGIRDDISGIRSEMSDIDQKVDGLAVMFTLLAGHVHHIEERVEALEKTR